ncbi:MAG: DNA repair protein RecN [Candidatus Metalachnospira sp.]|nr:DNA repair protein RecN [Candidatus Metalachnospira sp.]
MLEYMNIKNLALIQESEVVFGKGLNVLTGETGAGKSLIIDALGFSLGGRANKDIVRRGEEQAVVESVFSIDDKKIVKILDDMDIEHGDDNMIVIRRVLHLNGKSMCKVNGTTVTAGQLKELSECLVDFHGQHEHQSLLNSSKHIELLDKFCGTELGAEKAKLAEFLKNYKLIMKEMKAIAGNESERERRTEILSYQISELEAAGIKPGEEDTLTERKKILLNSERMREMAGKCINILYNGANGLPASDMVTESADTLKQLSDIDISVKLVYEIVNSAAIQLNEAERELKRYYDGLDADDGEMEKIEERLNIIYAFKKKYISTSDTLAEKLDTLRNEYDMLMHSRERLEVLEGERKELFRQMVDVCKVMTGIREKKAETIAAEIEENLQELEMSGALFNIKIEQKNQLGIDGWDDVEFLFTANEGEELMPLAKIASGGELSRVMLALKVVLGNADSIGTFVFDEIDTGISGRTAQKVAEKMHKVAKTKQILCITHLPQIASMADNHYIIEKVSQKGRTKTVISLLKKNEAIRDIARLTSGAQVTDVTLNAAREMKELADKYKTDNR